MTTIDKIEHLNKLCDDSLSITCYAGAWEISSYHKDSALYIKAHVTRKEFGEALDAAYAKAIEWERTQEIKRGLMTA
jgi:hypothetical protein